MIYTIDASVFVSRAVPTDVNHADSQAFMAAVQTRMEGSLCPSLVLVEVAAAIARPSGNARAAIRQANLVRHFPRLKLVGLSIARARKAARIAAQHGLRGADTLYVAVAQEFGTTLVTWDVDMLHRARNVVPATTPAQWIANPPAI